MGEDILFPCGEHGLFSYRIAGILARENQILLQRPAGGSDYSLIGGHVAFGECSKQTLEREFFEELHATISVQELAAVGEVFFSWGSKPCHQIGLYYRVKLRDESELPLHGVFQGYDPSGGRRTDVEFCWRPLENLEEITLYPKEIKPLLLHPGGEVLYFVSDEIGMEKYNAKAAGWSR